MLKMFKLSDILNPSSGSSSPIPSANSTEMRKETTTSLPGVATLLPDATSTMDGDSTQADTNMAASALASLAQTAASRTYVSTSYTSPVLDAAEVQRRQSSISLPPPVATSPTQVHSISPTFEQYHYRSNSPEQQRHQNTELPPLQHIVGAQPTLAKAQDNTPPSNLPLFIPAQVDRRTDRKGSVPNQPASSKSPETMVSLENLDKIQDPATRAAIEAAANEHGLRGSKKPSEAKSTLEPIQTVPKKRSVPKSVAASKKGTAQKASGPPSKKRKTEADPPRSSNARSATPVSKSIKTGIKSRASATPTVETPRSEDQNEVAGEDDVDMSSEGDDQLYCICRKPDDNKSMICCDACDEWFHSRCVNITETDIQLMDQFICPGCQQKTSRETTWKAMCRREGCRKPARLSTEEISKYCSNDCGLQFFQELITRSAEASGGSKTKRKGYKTAPSNVSEFVTHRAGALTPGQLKAMLMHCSEIDIFRQLGNSTLTTQIIDTPQKASSPTITKIEPKNDSEPIYNFTEDEKTQMDNITTTKEEFRNTRSLLKDRDRYITMLKERATAYNDSMKQKRDTYCGYDQRLSWTLPRFQRWRDSPAGIETFKKKTLDLPILTNGTTTDQKDKEKPDTNGTSDEVPDVEMSTANAKDLHDDDNSLVFFCDKKRCERHKAWQKLVQEDARFEEADQADRMRDLERREQELKDRARLRARRLQGPGASLRVSPAGRT